MDFSTLVFNPFRENTYIVWDESGEAVVIDAGAASEREKERLAEFITKRSLRPIMAVNTHGHIDHIFGVEFLRERFGVKFALNSKDDYLLKTAPKQAEMYGVELDDIPVVDIDLKDLTEIKFGNTTLQIIHTPGHTPGHVCLYEPRHKALFTGDLLFKGSIGRTDLPGGDYDMIMASIINHILPLGNDIKVYPGHGYDTTIGQEAMYNPFITEAIAPLI